MHKNLKVSLDEAVSSIRKARPLMVVSSIAHAQVVGAMKAVEGIAYEWRSVQDPDGFVITGEADIAVCETGQLTHPLRDGLTIAALLKTNPPFRQGLALLCRSDRADLRGLFYFSDVRNSYGKVWLVGAGPGSVDLITLRAIRSLAQADIVYYDDLVDGSLLTHCPGEHVYVGKRKDCISHPQDSINEMLYRSALEEKSVVRLKGGDPSIFGRAGEELDYLRRRWITVEIVPGVTSASAAAAAGLFSLTQRGISRSAIFRSGHGIDNDVPLLPEKETFVYYMAASKLNEVSHRLIREGVPPETPAVIIRNAGAWDETSILSSVEQMKDLAVQPPALLIVGKTTACARIEKKALFIGIDPSFVKVKEPVVHQPLIMPVPGPKRVFNKAAMPPYKTVEPRPTPFDLSYFSAVIFSSLETVDAFEAVYGNLPDHLLCYAADNRTREALQKRGVDPWRIVPCQTRGKMTIA